MSNEEEQILNIKVRYDDAINGIVKYKQAIEELQKTERVLQQDYKNGKITQEEYAKTTTAIAEQTKEYKGHIRELSKEIQNNIKTEKENEGSLRQLRAELSNVTKAYDSLSEAERKGAKGQELKKHINEITDKLKGAEAETQRFYRNVGNYEESIKGALGVNTSFAKSIMGMAEGGKGFGGIVDGMMTKVRAFGAALMSMMANPVFLSLAGIAGAGMAFKWFQDYNEGLMKASKLTTYFTGKKGEEMKAYRNEVMAVADALGIDFAETLKTANSLAQAFGISQEEALQKVKDGYLVGGSNVENFTQQLKTNAAAFVDLGVDADQYVGMMSQMGKTGLDVTTSMKAIEKGGLALRKMNKGLSDDLKAIGINSDDMVAKISSGQMTTLQAMQEVAKKMEENGATSQQTAQVMSDLFGRGAQALGSQFIHVLGGIGKGVSDIKSKSSEVVKLKDENIKVQAQLNNTISSMFDMTGGGYEKMKAQITLITSKALLAMAQAVVKVVNYFIDLYNESTLVRGLVELLTAQFEGMWNAVKLVFNLIVDSAKGAGRSLKGIAEILEGIVTFSFDKIKAGFNEIKNGYVKTFKEGFEDVKSFGQEAVKIGVDALNRTLKGAKVNHIEVPVTFGSGNTSATQGATAGGGVGGSQSGNVGSGGKTGSINTVSTAELAKKEEAARLAQAQKDLEEKISAIQSEYDEKRMAEKQMYLGGMYASDKEYENNLEELQKEEISAMLTAYTNAGDIGSDKAAEMQQRLLDLFIETRKKMNDEAKSLAADTVAAYKKDFDFEELTAEANKTTGDDEEAISAKLERWKAFLEAKMQSAQGNNDLLLELTKQYNQAETDLEKEKLQERIQNTTDAYNKILGYSQDFTSGISSAFSEMFAEEKATFKDFMRSILKTTISVIEKALLAYEAQILAKEIASKSWAGVASAAALTALISAAFEAAKAGVSKFSTGGYVSGEGTATSDSIPARLSNGESVMTASTTSMFAPALSAFNQIGGGVPIQAPAGGGNVGQLFLADAVARGFAKVVEAGLLTRAVAEGYSMAPPPQVSVEEINKVSDRVKVIERISAIK